MHALLLALLLSADPVEYRGKVVGVQDGDTFTLLVDKAEMKIRLHGIDAPESGQPFGSRSKEALSKLIYGKEVTVRKTGTSWSRTTGYVTQGDTDVNAEMVKSGFAWDSPQFSKGKYAKLEHAAREQKCGLWVDPNPVRPSEWRAGQKSKANRESIRN